MRVNLRTQRLSGSQLDLATSSEAGAPFVLECKALPTADYIGQSNLQVWQRAYGLGDLDDVSPQGL
jgi:hypothetical protein